MRLRTDPLSQVVLTSSKLNYRLLRQSLTHEWKKGYDEPIKGCAL
jgi:hypothetical protein